MYIDAIIDCIGGRFGETRAKFERTLVLAHDWCRWMVPKASSNSSQWNNRCSYWALAAGTLTGLVPRCRAVTHLEEGVQGAVLHELCYDHHGFTWRGHRNKAAISGAEKRGRKSEEDGGEAASAAAAAAGPPPPSAVSPGDNLARRHQSQ